MLDATICPQIPKPSNKNLQNIFWAPQKFRVPNLCSVLQVHRLVHRLLNHPIKITNIGLAPQYSESSDSEINNIFLAPEMFRVLSLRLAFRLLSHPIKITKICCAPQYVFRFLKHPIKIINICWAPQKFRVPNLSSVCVSSQSSRISPSLATSG